MLRYELHLKSFRVHPCTLPGPREGSSCCLIEQPGITQTVLDISEIHSFIVIARPCYCSNCITLLHQCSWVTKVFMILMFLSYLITESSPKYCKLRKKVFLLDVKMKHLCEYVLVKILTEILYFLTALFIAAGLREWNQGILLSKPVLCHHAISFCSTAQCVVGKR